MLSRDRHLSDGDVLWLVDRFRLWLREEGGATTSGLATMMQFLREALEAKRPLYLGVLERQQNFARQLVDDIRAEGIAPAPDVADAADYMMEQLHRNVRALDYDGAFLVCADFLSLALNGHADDGGSAVPIGRFNTLYGQRVTLRNTSYWASVRSENYDAEDVAILERPIIVDILLNGFPIHMFVDSGQFGLNAWDVGADISQRIEAHLLSPASQGQVATLVPSDVDIPVDWKRNAWARDPRFLDDLDVEGWWYDGLPGWIRERMI